MMKYVIILALVAVVVKSQEANVVSSNHEALQDGYKFDFRLDDDSFRNEDGKQSNPGQETGGIEIQGSYGHKTPEGRTVKVEYTAGEAGYKPRVTFQ